MEQPLVSVIVPVYKVEPYLRPCVDSILNQTYTNLEIILVDDGSPDNCPAICDEYAEKDSRIKVIHKKNGGQAEARNMGVAASSGDLITFIDSDDYVLPDYVSYLYNLMLETSADVSSGQAFASSVTGDMRSSQPLEKIQVFDGKTACVLLVKGGLKNLTVIGCAKLFRKDVLLQTPFPVGRVHEDLSTTYLHFYHSKKVAVGTRYIYAHYRNPDSTTTQLMSRKRMLDLLTAYWEQYQFAVEIQNRSLQKLTLQMYLCLLISFADKNDIDCQTELQRFTLLRLLREAPSCKAIIQLGFYKLTGKYINRCLGVTK